MFRFDNDGELDRVVGLFKLGTWQELLRLCSRTDAWELAKRLNVPAHRRESVLVKRLKDYIDSEDFDKGPKCDCELPEGLRWTSGGATYFYDDTDQPKFDFDPSEQIDKAAQMWMSICGVKLQKARSAREADIVITWADIDGIGRTLGMTYQPASGEDMAACGGPCGDILMDGAEKWNQRFFLAVFIHELGHAIGIPHAPVLNNKAAQNIMEAYYTALIVFGPWDIAQAVKRYGKPKTVNVKPQELKAA